MSIENILQAAPVVPVVVINDLEDAVPLATALYNGGLRALEITLRTPVAVEAIKQIKQALPDAYVGTGTVINKATFNASLEAGADFKWVGVVEVLKLGCFRIKDKLQQVRQISLQGGP